MTDPRDLDTKIHELRQLLDTSGPAHPDWARLLSELGATLLERFHRTGAMSDLDEAITHLRGAVAATPADDPARLSRLARLRDALQLRSTNSGSDADRDALADVRDQLSTVLGDQPMAWGEPDPGWAGPSSSVDADEADAPEESAPQRQRGGPPPVPGAAPPPVPPPAPEAAPPGSAPPPPAPAPAYSPPPAPVPVYGSPPPAQAAPPRAHAPAEPAPAAAGGPRPGRVADERLEFAAAYRDIVAPERPSPVLFYVHRPSDRDLVRQLIERRAPLLGDARTVAQAAAAQAVESGTTLTIVPNVLGATFEPARIDVVVDDTVRELTFQVTVPRQTPLGGLDGYIDIFVGPLAIGQVPIAFDVQDVDTPVPRQDPGEQLMQVANASIFDKIFVSYSHKDAAVVDLCVRTYQGLGVQVLVDHLDLRSGENWRAGLERMIRESNIFQLYWSSAAAASHEVRGEWELALGLRKARDRFIRPLYWETPMPPAPAGLSHLHFSKFDVKQLRLGVKEQPGFLRRAISAVLGTKAK
ncbi:MAG TPA: toll/interleukin-1 receptor domain-containing protein [Micromonosporaceae bacterium]